MIQAYTIEGFCEAHQLSRSFLYNLWKRDEGPRFYKVGTRRYISFQAATEWREAREHVSRIQEPSKSKGYPCRL